LLLRHFRKTYQRNFHNENEISFGICSAVYYAITYRIPTRDYRRNPSASHE
jgi:hypothetical protein